MTPLEKALARVRAAEEKLKIAEENERRRLAVLGEIDREVARRREELARRRVHRAAERKAAQAEKERRQRETCFGKSNTREYGIWKGMLARCTNPENKSWVHYGGRGITVCEEWHTFKNFIQSMGFAPSPRHSIDRIDNDKGYFPENCRWALASVQALNKRQRRGRGYYMLSDGTWKVDVQKDGKRLVQTVDSEESAQALADRWRMVIPASP